jgi:hypothetical protein
MNSSDSVCQWRWLDHAPARQCQQIDAELGKPGSVTELAALSRSTWNVEQ